MITLSEREKKLLYVLGGIITCTILYFLIINPIIEHRKSSDNELKSNVEKLDKLEKINADYQEVTRKLKLYHAQLNIKNENITSMIDQWANTSNISRNVAYKRRNQSVIQNKYIKVTTDIKFEGVSIKGILQFLYEVENANKLIKLDNIRINQAYKAANKYDITLIIDTFTNK